MNNKMNFKVSFIYLLQLSKIYKELNVNGNIEYWLNKLKNERQH